MGLVVFLLLLFVVLPIVSALGLTADSRRSGRWYPALSDRER
jgi:hypothetical protein